MCAITVVRNANAGGWSHNRVDAATSFFREIFSYRNYLQPAEAKLVQVTFKNLGNSQVTQFISVTKKTCQCSLYTIV